MLLCSRDDKWANMANANDLAWTLALRAPTGRVYDSREYHIRYVCLHVATEILVYILGSSFFLEARLRSCYILVSNLGFVV